MILKDGEIDCAAEKSEKPITYEEAMRRIEEISSEMEKESVSLDKLTELFEEAVNLISFCGSKLKDAELKIIKINEEKDF